MPTAKTIWKAMRPKPSRVGVAILGTLLALGGGVAKLAVGAWWAALPTMACLWMLGSWWARRPAAPVRAFMQAEREDVVLTVESVREMNRALGSDGVWSIRHNLLAVRVRLDGSDRQAVFIWRNPSPTATPVLAGQSLPAWLDGTSQRLLLKTPQRGLGLGYLLDDRPPPGGPPPLKPGEQGHPRQLDRGLSNLLLYAIPVAFLPLLLFSPLAVLIEDTDPATLETYGGWIAAATSANLALAGLAFIVGCWQWYTRCVGYHRGWKAALALGDGEARWAHVIGRMPSGEGPHLAHIWLPTPDGRVWQGSCVCVWGASSRPPLFSSDLHTPVVQPQLKEHGSWMPVWVFGNGRYVFNLQARQGFGSVRGMGVLTDRDAFRE